MAEKDKIKDVCVVVLGDVGRSPRMQYHCLSLASMPCRVSLVGYRGEKCIESIESHENIEKHVFDPFMKNFPVR